MFTQLSKNTSFRKPRDGTVLVGLPVSILAAVGPESGDSFARLSVSMVGMNVGGIFMSLGYLSLIVKRVERNPNSRLAISVGQLGRMALTGYLLESLLMSAIMSHWGLAWFGTTTWTGRAALVVVIYVAILFFANIWMRLFRFGPMEWLWRSLCYLKPQPMLRQG